MTLRRFSTSNISGSKSAKLWDGETFPGYFESIATAVGTYGANFTNIPTTYTHLQIRVTARDSNASSGQEIVMRFNGDSTANNYRLHILQGDGSGVGSNAYLRSYIHLSQCTSAFHSASIYSVAICDILDYQSTNKVKVIRSLGGFDINGATGYVELSSGMWLNSASTPITSIEVFAGSGIAVANNHFALYGIRSA